MSDFEPGGIVLTAEAVTRDYSGRPTRTCHEVEELVASHEALRDQRDKFRDALGQLLKGIGGEGGDEWVAALKFASDVWVELTPNVG